MFNPTFSESVNAIVPHKMTPDGVNHIRQKSAAVAREDRRTTAYTVSVAVLTFKVIQVNDLHLI